MHLYNSYLIKLRRRTFHELNIIRINVDSNQGDPSSFDSDVEQLQLGLMSETKFFLMETNQLVANAFIFH